MRGVWLKKKKTHNSVTSLTVHVCLTLHQRVRNLKTRNSVTSHDLHPFKTFTSMADTSHLISLVSLSTMGMKSMLKSPILFFFFFFSFSFLLVACSEESWNLSSLVRKDQRKSLVETEYGEISAVEVSDGTKSGRYHLQFFTLEPNALFLPVLLHADIVLYVHTGSGSLNWSPGDKEVMTVPLQRGDIYRIPPGSIFFLKNELKPERENLRIYAIFTASNEDLSATSIGAYSSITEMVRGFDKKVLQAAFKLPEDVIEAITNSTTPAIVHAVLSPNLGQLLDWETTLIRAFVGGVRGAAAENSKKKKKAKPFNVLKESPDFKNCNGWSLSVTEDDLPSLKQSNIGILFVNLTKGSMMGPHWNPMASEIAMVVQGAGMVQVVCASSATNESECKNRRFRVEEGDVFAVPRFHPMAQMSFNNDSLVFVGFSTATKKNYPQFLAGKASVLQVLDKDVLAVAFGVSNTTIKQVLAPQGDSIILECTSCAEDEEMKMQEEIQKEKEKEEARKREEEEEKRREEEKKKEEEEAKKREEEEKRREEEAKKKEEEEKKREEEEAKKKEEEEAKKKEEEEEKRREEEEAKKREEEEKKREEEEAKKREEEEKKREEEEAKKREEEEEAKKREEEEKKREEEEEEARRQREGEGEEEEAKKQDEERARKEEEQEKRREKEEAGGGGGRRVLLKRWKF